MRVELINTGSELMLGFTINSHHAYIARQLAVIGLRLDRQTTVADDRQEMSGAVAEALQRSDVLIITGGLGPTSDDFTRDIVAELLNCPLVLDEEVARSIKERYSRRNLRMPDSVNVQALVPAGATVLQNRNGTAPGLVIEHNNKLLVLLPGPPRELNPMMDNQVMPLLKERFKDRPRFVCRTFKVAGLPESIVEAKVAPVLAGLPDIELGYCARMGEVEVRIIALAIALADQAEQGIRDVLGNNIIGTGESRLEEVVVTMLTAAHKTLVVAESCTGGLIANRLTNVSGSSAVFLNGWVTYSNAAKMRDLGVREGTLNEFGAVSEQVAREMAAGARTRSAADYALSATGIAGPTGGTPDKPVGLLYIGLATRQRTVVQRHQFTLDRETFKSFASQLALDLLRRELLSPVE